MNRHTLPLALLLVLSPALAHGQVGIHIEIGLPAAPRLVVVEPGIQVVEGFQEEVFFNNGWYWCRRPNGWYRARRPQARFEWVEVRRVPRALVRVPAGHYRNWHHDHQRIERQERRSRREAHREWKAHKEERKERKEERKEDRKDRRDDRREHEDHREHHR